MDRNHVELMDYVTFRLTCLTCCMNCFIYGLINKEHRHRYLMLIKRPFQLCNNMTTEEYGEHLLLTDRIALTANQHH